MPVSPTAIAQLKGSPWCCPRLSKPQAALAAGRHRPVDAEHQRQMAKEGVCHRPIVVAVAAAGRRARCLATPPGRLRQGRSAPGATSEYQLVYCLAELNSRLDVCHGPAQRSLIDDSHCPSTPAVVNFRVVRALICGDPEYDE